jgi:2-polyprenyl-3-methyl-5-hydroxy-6-metoxy-1,4-benzoquinol methylase
MFKSRSNKKELLDADVIPEQDLILNLRELHTINARLGGYAVTLSALNKVIQSGRTMTLVDIGCGGGDTLKEIERWSLKNNFSLQLNGVDLKEVCISYSKINVGTASAIHFICDDYRNVLKHLNKIDILHASLFCHHLSNAEIVQLINFAVQNKIILVINDLERNPIAYYAIKFLTTAFSKSYLVKNDAPLSVLRGFKKSEWKDLLDRSTAKRFSVSNRWAFRHEVIVYE